MDPCRQGRSKRPSGRKNHRRFGPPEFEHQEKPLGRSYFHLHLVSDSTGETLITVARAVVA